MCEFACHQSLQLLPVLMDTLAPPLQLCPRPFMRCLFTGGHASWDSSTGCVLAVIILISSLQGVSYESLSFTNCSPSLAQPCFLTHGPVPHWLLGLFPRDGPCSTGRNDDVPSSTTLQIHFPETLDSGGDTALLPAPTILPYSTRPPTPLRPWVWKDWLLLCWGCCPQPELYPTPPSSSRPLAHTAKLIGHLKAKPTPGTMVLLF